MWIKLFSCCVADGILAGRTVVVFALTIRTGTNKSRACLSWLEWYPGTYCLHFGLIASFSLKNSPANENILNKQLFIFVPKLAERGRGEGEMCVIRV